MKLLSRLPRDHGVAVVGGAVRDAVLARPIGEIDLSVCEGGAEIAEQLTERCGGRVVRLGELSERR